MTREEQIKRAGKACNFGKCHRQFRLGAEYADAHPNWEAIVKRLQEEMTNDLRQDRWISVEDELPPQNGRYIFYSDTMGVRTSYYYAGISLNEHVTHWMPLPPPPSASGKPTNCMIKKGGEK